MLVARAGVWLRPFGVLTVGCGDPGGQRNEDEERDGGCGVWSAGPETGGCFESEGLTLQYISASVSLHVLADRFIINSVSKQCPTGKYCLHNLRLSFKIRYVSRYRYTWQTSGLTDLPDDGKSAAEA